MTRRASPVPTPLLLALLLAALPAAGDAMAKDLAKRWKKLDRGGKVVGLMALQAHPSAEALRRAATWFKDDDPIVRAQVARLVAACARDEKLAAAAGAALDRYVDAHLDARRKREKREFDQVCRQFGKRVPPADQMEAGRDWADPWDEKRRELPPEQRAERAHLKEVVGALEETGAKARWPALRRIFREHHDPEVVLAVIAAFGRAREWRALPDLADLARIQESGRELGGGDVIGKETYATLRLKWDVHKDRLWWSRPEYLPRARKPIRAAAEAITGVAFASARELDEWLLANEGRLRAEGVALSAAFRRRAEASAAGR